MLTIDKVKAILEKCTRYELRDHAFGDREVTWEAANGDVLAEGYFGGVQGQGVSFYGDEDGNPVLDENDCPKTTMELDGADGREALNWGTLKVSRNDSTGPDNYTDGACMPSLTLEGVRKELCGG